MVIERPPKQLLVHESLLEFISFRREAEPRLPTRLTALLTRLTPHICWSLNTGSACCGARVLLRCCPLQTSTPINSPPSPAQAQVKFTQVPPSWQLMQDAPSGIFGLWVDDLDRLWSVDPGYSAESAPLTCRRSGATQPTISGPSVAAARPADRPKASSCTSIDRYLGRDVAFAPAGTSIRRRPPRNHRARSWTPNPFAFGALQRDDRLDRERFELSRIGFKPTASSDWAIGPSLAGARIELATPGV